MKFNLLSTSMLKTNGPKVLLGARWICIPLGGVRVPVGPPFRRYRFDPGNLHHHETTVTHIQLRAGEHNRNGECLHCEAS
jgi:hypothetical protein